MPFLLDVACLQQARARGRHTAAGGQGEAGPYARGAAVCERVAPHGPGLGRHEPTARGGGAPRCACWRACWALLWMCNPLRIVYAGERRGALPGRPLLQAGSQPPCLRKGAFLLLFRSLLRMPWCVEAAALWTEPEYAGMRYEFGQTTLEGHSLAGEERFSVQWCKEDDSVWWGCPSCYSLNNAAAVASSGDVGCASLQSTTHGWHMCPFTACLDTVAGMRYTLSAGLRRCWRWRATR